MKALSPLAEASFPPGLTARSPVLNEGVRWDVYLDHQLPSYLHSQSDSGTLHSSQNARRGNRPNLSASYDQIPSYRAQAGNQFDQNPAQRFSSSLASNEQRTLRELSPFDFDRSRDRLLRGGLTKWFNLLAAVLRNVHTNMITLFVIIINYSHCKSEYSTGAKK